jgi:hypothetical protein
VIFHVSACGVSGLIQWTMSSPIIGLCHHAWQRNIREKAREDSATRATKRLSKHEIAKVCLSETLEYVNRRDTSTDTRTDARSSRFGFLMVVQVESDARNTCAPAVKRIATRECPPRSTSLAMHRTNKVDTNAHQLHGYLIGSADCIVGGRTTTKRSTVESRSPPHCLYAEQLLV